MTASRRRRKDRDIERARADILDAAARAFAREGFRGATMQAIADEASYTVPTLYAYFRGKEAILEALIHRTLGGLLDAFDEPLPAGLTLPQRIEAVHQHLFGYVEAHWDVLQFLTQLPPTLGPEVDADRAAVGRIADLLRTHAAPGELGRHTPESAGWILWGLGRGLFMHWLHDNHGDSLVARARDVADIFFHGIGGGAS